MCQLRSARRRATLTEWLETRFHGISGSCACTAATTAFKKRDFGFIFDPALFGAFARVPVYILETDACLRRR
ncbi:hypothetical protein RA28_03790 [Ruegeria sp. ANG-S4]|nr:hypothetical protein RA28_03790 [Ruegeria sp. ANG-S4]